MRKKAFAFAISAVFALTLAVATHPAHGASGSTKAVKNIVLVHGAFADGSSWAKVIPLLQAKGYKVTAVQNPLTSLDDDVAATKRAIDAQDGPVLLVGHSWAGVVITQVGTDSKVAGLVYMNAFAPNAGQSVAELGQGYPTPPGIKVLTQSEGFLSMPASGMAKFFAPDLPRSETKVMASTQGPVAASAFAAKPTAAAWKAKPSWYVVGSRDLMIDPALERAMAKKIKATVLVLSSSHVPMLSQPQKIAAFIASAAAKL